MRAASEVFWAERPSSRPRRSRAAARASAGSASRSARPSRSRRASRSAKAGPSGASRTTRASSRGGLPGRLLAAHTPDEAAVGRAGAQLAQIFVEAAHQPLPGRHPQHGHQVGVGRQLRVGAQLDRRIQRRQHVGAAGGLVVARAGDAQLARRESAQADGHQLGRPVAEHHRGPRVFTFVIKEAGRVIGKPQRSGNERAPRTRRKPRRPLLAKRPEQPRQRQRGSGSGRHPAAPPLARPLFEVRDVVREPLQLVPGQLQARLRPGRGRGGPARRLAQQDLLDGERLLVGRLPPVPGRSRGGRRGKGEERNHLMRLGPGAKLRGCLGSPPGQNRRRRLRRGRRLGRRSARGPRLGRGLRRGGCLAGAAGRETPSDPVPQADRDPPAKRATEATQDVGIDVVAAQIGQPRDPPGALELPEHARLVARGHRLFDELLEQPGQRIRPAPLPSQPSDLHEAIWLSHL